MKKVLFCREFWIPILIAVIITLILTVAWFWDKEVFVAVIAATTITFSLMGVSHLARRHHVGESLRKHGFPHPEAFRKGSPAQSTDNQPHKRTRRV